MEQKIPLYNPIKNSDRKVLETLVTANHRYVVCVAKRFQNNGLSLHELIIKGNLGLIKAAQHFDDTRGVTFISYAIWCIRQAIIQAFVEDISNKPIPLNKIGLISNRNSLFSKVELYCEREPTTREIEGMQEFQTKIMNDALQVTSNQIIPLRSNSCQPLLLHYQQSMEG